jgi:hypothetical protein
MVSQYRHHNGGLGLLGVVQLLLGLTALASFVFDAFDENVPSAC